MKGKISHLGKKGNLSVGIIQSQGISYSFNEKYLHQCSFMDLSVGQSVSFVAKKKENGTRTLYYAIRISPAASDAKGGPGTAPGQPTGQTGRFTPAQQAELYQLIHSAFSQEFEKNNCVLITALQPIAKECEEQFGCRPGKVMFLSMPEYFLFGYNEKKAACVADRNLPLSPLFTPAPSQNIPVPELHEASAGQAAGEPEPESTQTALPADPAPAEESTEDLNRLFEEGRFREFLSSPGFTSREPQQIPMEMMEKALTCAERLLKPESSQFIRLNDFEKALFQTPMASGFLYKWKNQRVAERKGVTFGEAVLTQFGDSLIGGMSLSLSRIRELLNDLGYSSTLNNNYGGIASRFSLCRGRLTPHLYVLRLFSNPNPVRVEEVIREYCLFLNGLRSEKKQSAPADDMLYFPSLLLLARDQYLLGVRRQRQEESGDPVEETRELLFSPTTRTILMGVFLDFNRLDLLCRVAPELFPTPEYPEWKLLRLCTQFSSCTREFTVSLVDSGLNLALIEKCCNVVWNQCRQEEGLSDRFLEILADIVYKTGSSILDEILTLCPVPGLSKSVKQEDLRRSFPRIIHILLPEDPSMYILADYIHSRIHVIRKYDGEDPALESWEELRENFCSRMLASVTPICPEKEEQLISLLPLFVFDPPRHRQFQELYGQWYLSVFTADEQACLHPETAIARLKSIRAHDAVRRICRWLACAPGGDWSCWLNDYIEAMLKLYRFGELIPFLHSLDTLPDAQRDYFMEQILCTNFETHRLSPQAFDLFTEQFTPEDAADFLLSRIQPKKSGIFISLIAIYCYTGEIMKALYIYVIHFAATKMGHAQFYSEFHVRFGSYCSRFQESSNHYDVIEYGFFTLPPEELIRFLKWARDIVIPNYKGYNRTHVCKFCFDRLLNAPEDPEEWMNFQQFLQTRFYNRYWMICVCQSVQMHLTHGPVSFHQSLTDAVCFTEERQFPCNFLSVIMPGIRDLSADFWKQLRARLNVPEILERISSNRLWCPSERDWLEEFCNYCVRQYMETGREEFFEIADLFRFELSTGQLLELCRRPTRKQWLLRRLCRNFLAGKNPREAQEILSVTWNSTGYSEQSMLELLRIVYTPQDELIREDYELLPDESHMAAFRQDCMTILRDFPKITGLEDFDEACADDTYRFTVFRYVFSVGFSQSIYDKYVSRKYTELTDMEEQRAFCCFMYMVYRSQFKANYTYDLFYFSRRYKKMLLARVLSQGEDLAIRDEEILEIMEYNKHTGSMRDSHYLPFRRMLERFLGLQSVSTENKRYFLFCLMEDEWEDFLACRNGLLVSLPDGECEPVRELILMMDYRKYNHALYCTLNTENGPLLTDRSLLIAQKTSLHAFDALRALSGCSSDPEVLPFFMRLACLGRPLECITRIMELNDETYRKYEALLVPLLCSRQFTFYLYARMRAMTVREQNCSAFPGRFQGLFDYLAKTDPSASSIFRYLCILGTCVSTGDRSRVREMLDDYTGADRLSSAWADELERIRQWSLSENGRFRPMNLMADSLELEASASQISFRFLKTLSPSSDGRNGSRSTSLEAARPELNEADLLELFREFSDPLIAFPERLPAGLRLLNWYTSQSGSRREKGRQAVAGQLPPYALFAFDLGLLLASPDAAGSPDEKLAVLCELFEKKNILQELYREDRLARLYETFCALFRQSVKNHTITLSAWFRYFDSVSDIVRSFDASPEVGCEALKSLQQQILLPCRALEGKDCSSEERLAGLRRILGEGFVGQNSSFASCLQTALRHEISLLEDGFRLQVSIVNENREISDGCLYFQIKNIGRRTVELGHDNVSVTLYVKAPRVLPAEVILPRHINVLRPGYVTGGRRRLNSALLQEGVPVYVELTVMVNDRLICRCPETDLFPQKDSRSMPRLLKAYNTGHPAYLKRSDTVAVGMFGRDPECEWLRRHVPSGFTVIYGPSRIGKSSLLNYIRYGLLPCQKQPTLVLSFGEKQDYAENFTDPSLPIPYTVDRAMAEYLLADTIRFGLRARSRQDFNQRIPSSLREEMAELMEQKTSLIDRFYDLNDLLAENNTQLWLLIDEFQEAIANWRLTSPYNDFFEVCEQLTLGKLDCIKLVLCGSDDLVKCIQCDEQSAWRKIMQLAVQSTCLVGPLEPEGFDQMICDPEIWADSRPPFTREAMDALYTYTGGIALYGKEICQALLNRLEQNPDSFRGRCVFYPSDVAEVTQALLDEQDNPREQSHVRFIFDAVTKNLDPRTEMRYLYYIARKLEEKPELEGISLHDLETFFRGTLQKSPREIQMALKVAVARGLLRENAPSENGAGGYSFRTLFYYYAFRTQARARFDLAAEKAAEEALLLSETEPEEEAYQPEAPDVSALMEQVRDMVSEDEANWEPVKEKMLGMLSDIRHPERAAGIKSLLGSQTIQHGDSYVDSTIDSSTQTTNNANTTNIQITNIQAISGVFADVLGGNSLPEVYRRLPGIESYLDPAEQRSIEAGLEQCRDEETRELLLTRQDELYEQAADRQCTDYAVAVVNNMDSLLSELDEEQMCELLHLTPTQMEELRLLPAQFQLQFNFATILHNIFYKFENSEEIDYCPAALMYCKLVEAMLKNLHTDIYIRRFEKETVKLHSVSFGELADPSVLEAHKKDLTIGSYTHPLINVNTYNVSQSRLRGKSLEQFGRRQRTDWEKHAFALASIQICRNKSAHDPSPVTREEMDALVETLFSGGELMRILELYEQDQG